MNDIVEYGLAALTLAATAFFYSSLFNSDKASAYDKVQKYREELCGEVDRDHLADMRSELENRILPSLRFLSFKDPRMEEAQRVLRNVDERLEPVYRQEVSEALGSSPSLSMRIAELSPTYQRAHSTN